MGIDYRAKAFFGVPLHKDDFIECVSTPVSKGGEVFQEIREVPKPNVLKYLKGWDRFEDWVGWLEEAYTYETEINGLEILSESSYYGVEEADLYLSLPVEETESNRSGGGCEGTPLPDVLALVEDMKAKLRGLGLEHRIQDIQLYTKLDVS